MKIGRYTYTGLSHSRRTPIPERPPSAAVLPTLQEEVSLPPAKPAPKSKPKRKALLIGITYNNLNTDGGDGYASLQGPHADVADMRRLLVGRYDYAEADIVTLLDSGDAAEGTQPTRVNILRAIDDLVRGASKGDRFFFHYCGHTTQIENRSNSEEDGMDECLVPIDGEANKIMDNELRRHLVGALPVGSSLVAVFDSCHSASLLDLAHFRCNRVYVPWLSKGRRKSDEMWNAVVRKLALPLLPLSRSGTTNAATTATPLETVGPTLAQTQPPTGTSADANGNGNGKEESASVGAPKPTRKPTRRETRELRAVVGLLARNPSSPAPAPAPAPVPSYPAPLASVTARDGVQKAEGQEKGEVGEELVPTRPNTPTPHSPSPSAFPPPHARAHATSPRDWEDARAPVVTTRRIYEAARTSTTQVRAWRTEVGALDVDVDVGVDGRGRGFEAGDGREDGKGEEEGGRRLKRAGTDGEAVGGARAREVWEKEMKKDAEGQEKDGKGTHRTQKHKRASLPTIPLGPLLELGRGFGQYAHGRGRGRRGDSVGSPQEGVDPWMRTGTATSRSQSRIRGGKNKSQSRQRRTTVTRARAVSITVGVGDGHGHGAGREREREREKERGEEKENTGPAVPTAPNARPSLRLAVPHLKPGEGTDGRRTSWLEDAEECESPSPVWECQGWNCRDPEHEHPLGAEEERAEVISLASCKDYQLTWEDKNGGSMTRELARCEKEQTCPPPRHPPSPSPPPAASPPSRARALPPPPSRPLLLYPYSRPREPTTKP
ncbi:caspase domain-containing protein [Mycena metata]|uniref:Caspase domain-containing protein n=1 Tax=Mycena metata TaxID=1033252 RepID=A0AAD7JKW2_9AGAR|nr:caspase domain-containing protein [Mycena metata]